MIRVGFVVEENVEGWIGGANYIRNLIGVVAEHLSNQVQPVVLIGTCEGAKKWLGVKGVEIVVEPLVRSASKTWRARKVLQRLVGRDPFFEAALRRYKIDVLSHSGHLGRHPGIPVVSWIPDFQHVRMPEFFGSAECQARDSRFRRLCQWSSLVIVSSDSARRDFEGFSPEHASKARVLQFVSNLAASYPTFPSKTVIKDVLGELPPFFHLPNQFWKHKNHLLAIKATKILAEEGRKFCVVATGNPNDLKQPEYSRSVVTEVKSLGLEKYFLMPGLVSYELVVALMANAVAVINPSQFEGWSTSVEEAKTLGRCMILSDIDVHREQNPQRGIYFNSNSSDDLAHAMRNRLNTYNLSQEINCYSAGIDGLRDRVVKFAQTYSDIIHEAVNADHQVPRL